jgi:ribonuclease P protein component
MPSSVTCAFPRTARLLTPAAYKEAFASGRRFSGRHLTLVAANNSVSRARLGLAIAKKNLPRALDRNRVKRLCRECFRVHRHLEIALDLIVLTRPSAKTASNAELRTELTELFDKALRKRPAPPTPSVIESTPTHE